MAKTLRERVRGRAADCCEYRHMPQQLDVQPFQIDHIRAEKHGGRTTFANLALACLPCNAFKGPNVAGYDPLTNALQRCSIRDAMRGTTVSFGTVRFWSAGRPSVEPRLSCWESMFRIGSNIASCCFEQACFLTNSLQPHSAPQLDRDSLVSGLFRKNAPPITLEWQTGGLTGPTPTCRPR